MAGAAHGRWVGAAEKEAGQWQQELALQPSLPLPPWPQTPAASACTVRAAHAWVAAGAAAGAEAGPEAGVEAGAEVGPHVHPLEALPIPPPSSLHLAAACTVEAAHAGERAAGAEAGSRVLALPPSPPPPPWPPAPTA
jgi:hypothetical protein